MTRKRARVALTAAAAITAVAVIGAMIVPPRFTDTKPMCAEFTDGVGIYPGNKVQLLGIEVGSVTAVTNKPDHVQIDFTVSKDLDLPADVGAVTYSQSIVSDRHVELTKPYAGGPKFTGARCISLERTKTPIGVSETFTAVDKLANAVLGSGPGQDPSDAPGAQAINDSLRAASRSLEGTGPELNQTLRALVAVIGDPYQADADYRQLIENGEMLTTTLLQHWDTVATVVRTLPESLLMIEGLADGFGSALHHLAHALPILVEALNRFAPRVYHNVTDKLIPWIRDILNAYTPNIVGAINGLSPVTNWLASIYQPAWGTHNVTYLPPQVTISPSQAEAFCSVLRQRNTPGSQAACATRGAASDPVTLGLTDLILGAALP
ncbi:MCE family protein [Mycobacterium shinjukuense]|uniref:Putative Mce family protein n=1 Tax=Mycobacterium shinjukuense TaxID=398694 RepID=A0A7I7MVQ3_9MYCO|nr:MlaD family protein [Mycobacterium shinjukuense]MCV6987513.1 MCE family protein [Mycobacterium shinjukuense]ORB69978.1 mammalian cell entry protein [Mycobacterium shinjukuense]BBX75957.1 putative Mce family protein [Mycobacterium shinjukuense]